MRRPVITQCVYILDSRGVRVKVGYCRAKYLLIFDGFLKDAWCRWEVRVDTGTGDV